ncbi:type II toxin-antitoxin system death-on-curing family toxin [Vallitalea guaymasensis]|uniref:type II toxin-antitoxin system death-on-curing family toxin n=1 Tax=Vallitalea guaymasensis TaxID=1185412 RepID=UPI000DE28DE8|nr:Fic family protein [Vallitalea guaymasensis]
MNNLDVDAILFIHKYMIEWYGGDNNYYAETINKIESILSQQYGFFSCDKYPTVFQKAAMLLYFFVKDHCFVDGNKRVALQSAVTLLNLNGYEDIFDDKEAYELVIKTAKSNLKGIDVDNYIKDEIAKWFENNFISINSN